MAILWLFIAVIVAGVILAVVLTSVNQKRGEMALATIPDFVPSARYVNAGDASGLAIDPATEKLAIVEASGRRSIFYFENIISVEICRNGSTLTKTNRGSQVAGAAVGALLLGPAGLLLGGLTGSKRQVEKITRLSLKIYR